jgi:formate dehydrogenase major subunit
MSTNGPGKQPLGYGHDHKGAAVGEAVGDGKPIINMDEIHDQGRAPPTIKFNLDGQEVEARDGETIFRVARRYGVKLPHLCYLPKPGYRPDGNCRVCMVEVEGERTLAASCIRRPTAPRPRGG